MSQTYRITPASGVPVLRCAATLKGATRGGLREFPQGLLSVDVVGIPELARLAAEGVPLPVAARHRVEVRRAVQREKAKADARVEAFREKQREKVRAKQEEDREQRRQLKAQAKAERASAKLAEKRRQAAADRSAKKLAEKQQQEAAQAAAVALMVDASDTRLPWED